jgi:hypothetical protein
VESDVNCSHFVIQGHTVQLAIDTNWSFLGGFRQPTGQGTRVIPLNQCTIRSDRREVAEGVKLRLLLIQLRLIMVVREPEPERNLRGYPLQAFPAMSSASFPEAAEMDVRSRVCHSHWHRCWTVGENRICEKPLYFDERGILFLFDAMGQIHI